MVEENNWTDTGYIFKFPLFEASIANENGIFCCNSLKASSTERDSKTFSVNYLLVFFHIQISLHNLESKNI